MSGLQALTPRTRRRHAHFIKAPTLVHLDRVSLGHPNGRSDQTPLVHGLSLRVRAGERWQVWTDDRRLQNCLLRCVAGLLPPRSGNVTIRGHISWPLGQVAGLSSMLSCAENSRFLAGIYVPPAQKEEHLNLIQQLCATSKDEWNTPLKQIDRASHQRFRLALSLAFDFDLYVLNPAAFRPLLRQGSWTEAWQATLDRRLRERALITLGTDDLGIGERCLKGLVLGEGRVLAKGSMEKCKALLAEQPRLRAMEA